MTPTKVRSAAYRARKKVRDSGYKAALVSISANQFGAGLDWSDQELIEYWRGLALGYRNKARKALGVEP